MPDELSAQDKERAELANAIGMDPVEIEEPKPPPEPAPEKDKDKPSGEPETSEEKAEREKVEAEAKRKEAKEATKGKPRKEGEPEGGEPPEDDPLKGLELKDLLAHPVHGPNLQRWSDNAGNTRIATALDGERDKLAATAKLTAEEEQSDAHFASMSKEEIAEEISGNEDAAVKFAQYKARLQAGAGGGLAPEAVARASEIYAVSAQVLLNTQMLEGSELPPDVKEGLKPENFNKPGGEGLNAWGGAIFKALVTAEARVLAEQLKESEWDAYLQEHLAETDGERPAAVGGRRTEILPDLIETPTDTLWGTAFEGRPLDKEGAK